MRLEDGAFRAAVLDEGESLTIKREEEPQALSVGTGGMMCFTAQGVPAFELRLGHAGGG